MQVVIFWEAQRGPAPYTKRSAMHKLDIGGANAGAGGMSISSGSGGAGASGVGASSASSDASAMAIPRGLREQALVRSVSPTSRQERAARCPLQQHRGRRRCVRASDATQWSKPCSRRQNPGLRATPIKLTTVVAMPCSSRWRPRTERARVALACVWMQLLKLWKTATSQGCKYDVLCGRREGTSPSWRPGCPTGVDAGHAPENDPRLSFLTRVRHVVLSGRELQDRGRR